MRLTQVLREKAADDLVETKGGIGRRDRERKEAAKGFEGPLTADED
jgi:hypothetical protein